MTTRHDQASEAAITYLATKYGTLDPEEMFIAGWLMADKTPRPFPPRLTKKEFKHLAIGLSFLLAIVILMFSRRN